MSDLPIVAVAVLIFLLPCALLAMAIRHLIPLMRGFNAPLWGYALGPFALATDRFLSETARPHRKRFLAYSGSFAVVCIVLVFGFRS
jgi:hypothetical protein